MAEAKPTLPEGDPTEAPEVSLEEVAPAPEEMSVDARLAAVEGERDEMRDRWMRALADAENVRKRADQDRRNAEAYGGTRIARDLLPVFDNLKRALDSVPEDEREAKGGLVEGVDLTLRELVQVMTKNGIEAITPAVGEKFDPQVHEAMFEAPVPGTAKGDILEVMATGFTLNGRLLRPAQVGVSSMAAS